MLFLCFSRNSLFSGWFWGARSGLVGLFVGFYFLLQGLGRKKTKTPQKVKPDSSPCAAKGSDGGDDDHQVRGDVGDAGEQVRGQAGEVAF